MAFGSGDLEAVRAYVGGYASRCGLSAERAEDAVLAVNELATNSIKHGGGQGWLRAWREPDALVYEVRDAGFIADPLVGRRRPSPDQVRGFGVWLVNHLCDLVELRSSPTGSVIRAHFARRD